MPYKKLKEYLKDKKTITKNLISGINIFLILLVLNTLSNNFGMFDNSIMFLFSIYVIVGFIFLNIPIKKLILSLIKIHKTNIKILFGLLIILASIIIMIITDIPMLWISVIPILIIGMDLLCSNLSIKRKEFTFLIASSFFYSIFYILLQTIPQLWNLISQFSLLFSAFIGSLTGKRLLFGPSVSGVWIVIIFLIYSIGLFILSYERRKLLKIFVFSILGLLISWILYIIILGFVEFEGYFSNFIIFLFCLVPTFIITSKSNFKNSKILEHNFNKIISKKLIKSGWIYSVIFLFISMVVLSSFIVEDYSKSPDEKILFYGQNMLGTWDIPEYGKYGREASGMFGLLPIYLTAADYKCEIVVENITNFLNVNQPQIMINNTSINSNQTEYITIQRYTNLTDFVSITESPNITADILKDVEVFVVVNVNKSFSEDEIDIIWDFVKNGGSLLVLGDHTNVGEIQNPLNDLINKVGISYRFDSALPLDSKFKWQTSYHLPYNSITSNIKNNNEIQISVGASLDISKNSFPMIIGRYAFSDLGDIENKDFAYLGDYEYNEGEQLGDIILAAGSYYGSGKVIVFGDTSSFQNSAMAYSFWFIKDIFHWLSSEKTGTIEFFKIIISIIFLIACITFLIIFKNNNISLYAFPIAICIAIIASIIINPIILGDYKISGDLVYIDSSHNERFSHEPFTDDSLNGLILNFNRNGYFPIFLSEFSKDKLKESRIIVLNAPTQPFNSDELRFIKKFMFDGGFVILATGYNDKYSSSLILNEFELDVEEIPLGPVPYVEDNIELFENETRFVDSWPIIFNEDLGVSYYSFNFTWSDDFVSDYHLMVFVRHGLGGLLLISDSSYLLDKNIESIYDYWPGNILMIKHIIDEFREIEGSR